MFQCDRCQTEYGGIRGLAPGACPRCNAAPGEPERRDWATRPFSAVGLTQPVSPAVFEVLALRAERRAAG